MGTGPALWDSGGGEIEMATGGEDKRSGLLDLSATGRNGGGAGDLDLAGWLTDEDAARCTWDNSGSGTEQEGPGDLDRWWTREDKEGKNERDELLDGWTSPPSEHRRNFAW